MFSVLKRKADSPPCIPSCASGTSSTSGAGDRGLLCSGGGWTVSPCLSLCLPGLCHPGTPLSPCLSLCPFGLCHPRRAPRDTSRSESRVHLSSSSSSSRALTFPISHSRRYSLPFHNPAPAPGKPWIRHRDLLAGHSNDAFQAT